MFNYKCISNCEWMCVNIMVGKLAYNTEEPRSLIFDQKKVLNSTIIERVIVKLKTC